MTLTIKTFLTWIHVNDGFPPVDKFVILYRKNKDRYDIVKLLIDKNTHDAFWVNGHRVIEIDSNQYWYAFPYMQRIDSE